MVQSLYCAKKYVTSDVIIVYSDIIFDPEIINILIKKNNNCLPLKTNWKKIWQLRMNKNKIVNDAEDLKLSKKQILSIGGKFKHYPKAQYMGIIKFDYKDFLIF